MRPLSAVRSTWKRSITVIATLTVVALAILPGQVGPVSASTARFARSVRSAQPAQPTPTIVLEHRAWADGSSWSGVVRRLQRAGYTVDAPPNPLRGLSGDSAYLASFLATVAGPIILVGHSYGGAVITNAATGNPNVKALVYIDAFIPDQGDTLARLLGAQPGSCLGGDPTQVFNFVPDPGAPAGDVDLYIKPALFPSCFANEVSAAKAAVLAAVQRPLALNATSDPSGAPAWKTIPSWSLIGTDDHVIPPVEQRIMSQRAGAHITEVRASHLSPVDRPDAVADIITQAVHATM